MAGLYIRAIAPGEPSGGVERIMVRVCDRFGRAHHHIARWLVHKARRAVTRIPVVVSEMMEGTLGNCPSARPCAFERNRDIEAPARNLADALRDYSCLFIFRHAHRAFMWMARKVTNDAAGGRLKQGMNGAHYLDRLEVAVGTRMKVRPGNVSGIGIVDDTIGWVRIKIVGVE